MTIEKILLQFDPKQKNLLAVLKEIQKEFGFVSKEAILSLAEYFGKKPASVWSTASFYDQIKTEKQPPLVVEVCDGTNCAMNRADDIIAEIERLTGVKEGEDSNGSISIKRKSCFGFCAQGPIVKINETIFEKVTSELVDDILKPYFRQEEDSGLI